MYHGNLAASIAAVLVPGKSWLVWNIRHSLYGLTSEKLMTRQVIRANRFLSSRPGVILYNSNLSREQHEAFGFKSEFGQVIPNGFDLERFRLSEDAGRITRDSLGISSNSRVVGHVARFHPMKNHHGFVRVAVRVGAELKDAHFVLSGRDVVPDNDALTALVPDAMRDRFHWLGDREDIPNLMCAMDVLCQSSSWGEGFPNVLGEAMATGVPCVATDVGDSAEIIGDTGLVVPPRNEEALASALMEMLKMPAGDRRVLGRTARNRITERYSLKTVVGEYAAIYEGLVRRPKGAR
jgi:glycosyltransferase involved in cell wall biosynthesis